MSLLNPIFRISDWRTLALIFFLPESFHYLPPNRLRSIPWHWTPSCFFLNAMTFLHMAVVEWLSLLCSHVPSTIFNCFIYLDHISYFKMYQMDLMGYIRLKGFAAFLILLFLLLRYRTPQSEIALILLPSF